MIKYKLGRKGFVFAFISLIITEGKIEQELKLGRNLEVGADAEVMGGWGFLACSSCFPVELRTTRGGTDHNGLGH